MDREPSEPAGGAAASPGFEYFDHDADYGVVGRGRTIEAAFQAVARGVFALAADPSTVPCRRAVTVSFEEPDIELALVAWLNELLAVARIERLALSSFHLERHGNRWLGWAAGSPWNEATERGIEVKGATLTALSVQRDGAGWEARCVVDV